MPALEIHYPDGSIQRHELEQDQLVVIGRHSACDVRIREPGVEPIHCRITLRQRGQYQIEAGPSVAQLDVDGRPVQRASVQPGASVRVGPCRIRLVSEEKEDVAAEAPPVEAGSPAATSEKEEPTSPAPVTKPVPAAAAEPESGAWSDSAHEESATDLPSFDQPEEGWLARWRRRREVFDEDAPSQHLLRSRQFFWLVGILVLLCVVGPLFYFLVWRDTARSLFKQAMQARDEGRYSRAIQTFDRFLSDFPGNEAAPTVRVLRAISAVQVYTETTNPNWAKGLTEARGVFEEFGDAPNFDAQRGKFGQLLGSIATGLADVAVRDVDPEAAKQCREALALLDQAVPDPRDRPPGIAQECEERLADAQSALEKVTLRQETLANMQEAVAAADFTEAYRFREELLRRYADLATDSELGSATDAALGSEREQVRAADTAAVPAHTEAHASPVVSQRLLVRRSGGADSAPAGGPVVYAGVADSIHAIDAASGVLLWRYPIGYNAPFEPIPLSVDGRSVVLLGDTIHEELALVADRTGELVWRVPLGEPPVCAPRIVGRRLYLPLRSGRLLFLELANGEKTAELAFPQPLTVTPAADPLGTHLYQPAEQSTMYVVSVEQESCVANFYLGHGSGSLMVGPVRYERYLLLFENDRLNSCRLRALFCAEDEETLEEVEGDRLEGWVYHAVEKSENFAFVSTDHSMIYAFRVAPVENAEPVSLVARARESAEAEGPPFLLARGIQEVWSARAALKRWSLNAPEQRFERGTVMFQSADHRLLTTSQPLRETGGAVFLAQHGEALPGVAMTAVPASGGEPQWQLALGSGLLSLGVVGEEQQALMALTRSGDLFRLSADELLGNEADDGRWGVLHSPRSRIDAGDQLVGNVHEVVLSPSLRAYWSIRSPERILFRQGTAKSQTVTLTWRTLPMPLQAVPVPFKQGLLAAGPDGRVDWLSAPELKPLAKSFQAAVELERPAQWRSLAVASDDSVIACDDIGNVYRLALLEEPLPHLSQQQQGTVPSAAASEVAVAGDTAYFVDNDGVLRAVSCATLEATGQWKLGGGLGAGPFSAGDFVIVADRAGAIRCLDGQGEQAWEAAMEGGPIAGTPLVDGDRCYLVQQQGVVRAVSLAEGTELWSVDAQQSLAAGPARIGEHLVVGAHDDSLLVLPAGAHQR